MRFATLGSGSSGNATVVEHDGAAILIDCGLSAREALRRTECLDLNKAGLLAILVTHEHDDHVAGAGRLARRLNIPVCATAGTRLAAANALNHDTQLVECFPGRTLHLGPFEITPVIVPHDAREPCQFVIHAGTSRFGILTDLGHATPHLEQCYVGLHGLMIEFNHEPELLAASPYPNSLKQRISSDYGHLSNHQAGALLERLDLSQAQHLVAAHLSEKTNSRTHVEPYLRRLVPAHASWHIAAQDEPSPWFELAG